MHLVQVFFGEGLRMDLLRKNLRIVVSDDDGKLGELAISQGQVKWWSRYAQKSRRLNWSRFDKAMQGEGRSGHLRPWKPIKARVASGSKGKARR